MAKKRRDPNSIPALTKKLDAIFSRYIRLAAADEYGMVKCVTCDHRARAIGDGMQAGHWIPRQYKATRWAEWNVWPQCYACNMHFGGRPQEYRDFMEGEYGDQVESMALERHGENPWDRESLKGAIQDYKAKVAALESE